MDLRKEILREHSKAQCNYITSYIGDDEIRFAELVKLFLHDEYQVSQRASWILTQCAEKYPFLIFPYLESIINNLRNPVHDAVKRNTLRTLQFIEIPERLFDITAELCFNILADKKETIASRVFSMTVLLQIVKKVPELKIELQVLLEDQMPYSSAGFVSRGKRILAALHKV